jgi:hypothetical protein
VTKILKVTKPSIQNKMPHGNWKMSAALCFLKSQQGGREREIEMTPAWDGGHPSSDQFNSLLLSLLK